ncbi:MAG: MFS transporter [Bacillota bacterium]
MDPQPAASKTQYDPQIAAHNTKVFIGDGTFFNLGQAFLEGNSMLPTFVSTLTSSPFLIGVVSSLRAFGYLMPQIFVAGYIDRLKYKKPFMMKAGYVMRISALVMAASALLAVKNRGLALAIFYLSLIGVAFGDGFGGPPWMEIVAVTIPANRRSGLFGTMQACGGVAAFSAGFVIQWLLGNAVPYPYNYALTLFLGALFLSCSLLCMVFIKDPGGNTPSKVTGMSEYLRRLPSAWSSNALFRHVIYTRLLMGAMYLALPFFAIHAQKGLGFAPSMVGLFVSAQMVGGVGGGPLWGYLGDRHGPRWIVRLVTVLFMMTGVLALFARLTFFAGLTALAFPLYLVLYGCLGAGFGGTWIGYTNYILDIAPESQRATLVGLFNTISAPLTLLTMVGGWLLQATNYTVLFIVEAAIVLISVTLAWRLPDSREYRT